MDENRIILIKGTNSQWYEQAIFILKNPAAAKRRNLVLEAERIINDYMSSGGAGIVSTKLERYKKNIEERAAANKTRRAAHSAEMRPVCAEACAPAIDALKKQTAKKRDYVNIFICACLIISCILFGFIMNKILAL